MEAPSVGARLRAADGTVYVVLAVHNVPGGHMHGVRYGSGFLVNLASERGTPVGDLLSHGFELTELQFAEFSHANHLKPA